MVSLAKKTANIFEYTKGVMNHFIGSCYFLDEVVNSYEKGRDLRILYLAYNLQLPDSYFHYVTNPLNSSNADYQNWPARLRQYSIIRPNITLLEGEYDKRPFSFTVKVNNSDAVSIARDKEYQALLQTLEQMFINELNQRGAQTGQPTQEVELPTKIKAKFQANYMDERAVQGEAALNILVDELALEEHFKKMFKDWLIAGEVYSYKGVRGNDLVYDRVSPLDIDFDKSPDTDYIEDGQWAVRRMFLTLADVIDHWYDELSAQDIDIIEESTGGYVFKGSGAAGFETSKSDEDLRRNKIEVYHVTWKYMTKIGILSYTNPMTGEMEEMEVPETYKQTGDEIIDWYWVNEVWEGYRIDANSEGIYVGIKPVPMQRNRMNNFSECKLPYNGKKFSDTHAQNISILEMGMPYEIQHRILHYQLEKTIAKSKGKILLVDQNSIPRGNGWNEEKFFYWAEANGWGILNRNQVGVDKSFNQYQVLDMGLYQHINNLIEIMEYVKTEWDELVGITRQRKGKTETSETATGVSAAVSQSAVISERVFTRFEEFIQRELAGLLDCSKMAWINGKKRQWFGDDMRSVMLDIDPVKYTETEYGVYVSKSPRDIQSLEMVRQQIQAFAQNGMPPSALIDVVRARSLSRLQQILKEREAESIAAQQQSQLSEQEAAERLEMIKGQYAELLSQLETDKMNAEYDRKETIEHIKGAYSTYFNAKGDGDNNDNGIPDPVEVQANLLEAEDIRTSADIERMKLAIEDKNKNRELDIKEQEVGLKKQEIQEKAKDRKLKEKEITVKKQIEDKKASVAAKKKPSGGSK
jgi:hypothetical protein